MWGFFWLFWFVPLIVLLSGMRRRRWRRWSMMHPGWYPPYPPPWMRGRGYDDSPWPERGHGPARSLEDERSTIEALESRVAQLEERLDFTERLLAGRQHAPPPA